jgi:hypothetical protein
MGAPPAGRQLRIIAGYMRGVKVVVDTARQTLFIQLPPH